MAAPALIAVWALAGFYGSLGPTMVRLLSGSHSFVLGGLSLFVLAISGAITVLVTRNQRPHSVLLLGMATLFVGVGITLAAVETSSITLFFIGAVVSGSGFGAGFQGAIRTVIPLAAQHERAGVLSLMYVVSYLALGLPAVIAGYLVVHTGGVLTTAREYGIAVMVLAALALIGVLRQRRSVARSA